MQKFSTINAKYCRGLSIFDKDNHFATCKSYIGWDPLKSHTETTFRHYLSKDEIQRPLWYEHDDHVAQERL